MKAMVLNRTWNLQENNRPLDLIDLPIPSPKEKELLIKVSACGVCHTEIDEIEGRTPPTHYPMIPGHQIVGIIESIGRGGSKYKVGERVGVAWIFSACGKCSFCLKGEENLCVNFRATGRDAPGGYAQYVTVPEDFVYPIPEIFSDTEAAPLLCAGAVGYRSIRLAGMEDGHKVGLTGFGASAHLVLQSIRYLYPNSKTFVFARGERERGFARELGAAWTGDIGEEAPDKLDSIIDTTPVWKPVVEALKNLAPGGRLVINAIRKENVDKSYLENLDYSAHLWLEKEIKSVANVTRRDVSEWLDLASRIPIRPEIQEYPLEDANLALMELKTGKVRGAKVLRII